MATVPDDSIEVSKVGKVFGSVRALNDVSLSVSPGGVLGLLGHNGAGKSTLIDILSGVLEPTTGTATVAGFDVVSQASRVRRRIGVAGQYVALDEQISGRDNLVLIARLMGARRKEAVARTDELLERFGMTGAADRAVRTYSGGMRRRIDLAASIVGAPEVLFLDEPTAGLDPESRAELWAIVHRLTEEGVTVLLTTQYLEEADRLADQVVLLSRGHVVASGSPSELKRGVGRRKASLGFNERERFSAARDEVRRMGLVAEIGEADFDIDITIASPRDLGAVIHALEERELGIDRIRLFEPSLEDVYLAHVPTR